MASSAPSQSGCVSSTRAKTDWKRAAVVAERVGDDPLGRREAEVGGCRDTQRERSAGRSANGVLREKTFSGSRESPDTIAESIKARSGRCAPSAPALKAGSSAMFAFRPESVPASAGNHAAAERGGCQRAAGADPVASGTMPQASAAAEPPDDPRRSVPGRTDCRRAIDRIARIAARAPFGRVGLCRISAPAARSEATAPSSCAAIAP